MQKRHFSRETEKWRQIESALFLFVEIVFFVKLLHASGGIQQLLFACVERVAQIADIHFHLTFG